MLVTSLVSGHLVEVRATVLAAPAGMTAVDGMVVTAATMTTAEEEEEATGVVVVVTEVTEVRGGTSETTTAAEVEATTAGVIGLRAEMATMVAVVPGITMAGVGVEEIDRGAMTTTIVTAVEDATDTGKHGLQFRCRYSACQAR